LQIAFHHHAIRNLQDQEQEQNDPGPELKIEFVDINLPGLIGVLVCTMRDDQQDQREEEQNAPRGREFLEHSPEKLFDYVDAAPAVG
jgi:hypothetical protein